MDIAPRTVEMLIFALARMGLVVLRLTPLTLVLPYLGGRLLPAQARLPILFVLAVGTMPALLHAAPVTALTPWILVAASREITVGIALAIVLGSPFFALEQGGRLLDAARGANVAEVIAPDTGARSSPLSELLRWSFGVVFVTAGGFAATIRVVAASLAAIPPDPEPAHAMDTARLVEACARWSADALAASVTLVGAGLLALVAAEIVLGIASRLSPPLAQSNLALPVRVLAPLAALAVAIGIGTGAARDFAADALRAAGTLGR